MCIDCCFEVLKETKPEIEEEDKKIDQFIEYFENKWISDRFHFDNSWNINIYLEPIILVKLLRMVGSGY